MEIILHEDFNKLEIEVSLLVIMPFDLIGIQMHISSISQRGVALIDFNPKIDINSKETNFKLNLVIDDNVFNSELIAVEEIQPS